MYQLIKHILFILFFLSSSLLFSQNKTKLEKEKQELLIKIKQTQSQLNKEEKFGIKRVRIIRQQNNISKRIIRQSRKLNKKTKIHYQKRGKRH